MSGQPSKQWFEVDKEGLKQLLGRRPQSFVVAELIQNAWDEDVADVEISISKTKAGWVVSIIDDSPEGFADLADSFTLFKSSKKKGNAEKRGRFNLGEKLVLALASEAVLLTTKGEITFDKDGRHVNTRRKRPAGTTFSATFPSFTATDADEVLALCHRLIPPKGVHTFVKSSGVQPIGAASFAIQEREPVASFEVTLPTEIADNEGVLRRSNRKTTVDVFEPDGTFVPAIYELGIPVVDLPDDSFVVDVGQKVPLNFDRDNVTPAFLRQLRTAVLNNTAHLLDAEDTTSTWVAEALSDRDVDLDVVRDVITKRYGNKVVAFDPSDQEANKIATAQGYTVLGGRTFNKQTWENVRSAGIIEPAGRVTPSASVLTSANGIPPLDRADWTRDHHRIADYAKSVHRNIVLSGNASPVECVVDFQHKVTANAGHSAWYGRGHLTINIQALGKAWLKNVSQEDLDALLIHEFGHYYSDDHLSSRYYDALCTLGARLRARSEKIGELR